MVLLLRVCLFCGSFGWFVGLVRLGILLVALLFCYCLFGIWLFVVGLDLVV